MTELTKSETQSDEGASTKVWSDPRLKAIRAGVLAALGCPAGLLQVAVVPLWGDNFRVNVWTAGSRRDGDPQQLLRDR